LIPLTRLSPAGTAILEAAKGVFLRYGFKKTSMDDLARAAGLSRQGLYLHFATKDELFKAAVLHILQSSRAAAQAALANAQQDIEMRPLDAFEAMHGPTIGQPASEHMAELLATTQQILGNIFAETETAFIADIARALRNTDVAAAWKALNISTKDLAEHLYAASYGIKHRVATVPDYRGSMRIAIRIVCRGAPR
jgi:AcrR family transcriptional regulator